MKALSLYSCHLVPLMRMNFIWNNKNNNNQSTVDKKCKLLQALVKNGDAQCIQNIWNRCFCNYDALADYAVFTGLCWYLRSWMVLQGCTGAMNWKRGHTVWGKTCPLCFPKCFLSIEFWLLVNYYLLCLYQIVIFCHEIAQVCWCRKSGEHKHAIFWIRVTGKVIFGANEIIWNILWGLV